MPIEYTFVCAGCGQASEATPTSTPPAGWIVLVKAPLGPDYLDKWECVISYAQKQKAAEEAVAVAEAS